MSRSGYSDDLDTWALVRWRGAVTSAARGKRGQEFFRELLAALDAMPEKRLIRHELESDGEFCTLGVLGRARGIDMENIDASDPWEVSGKFNVACALAQEVVFENDEAVFFDESPEARWRRMRDWVARQIMPDLPQ